MTERPAGCNWFTSTIPANGGHWFMNDPMRDTISKYRIFIAGCFLLLFLYLVYIVVDRGKSLSQSSANLRPWLVENRVVRGGIYARGGEALAESTGTGDNQRRSYPFGPLYAQLVGYNSRRLGKTGLEKAYDAELLGLEGSWMQGLEVRWGGTGLRGNNLYLTVDHPLQQRAMELLAPYKGAAVVLDPRTGAVLALASSPSFDPNQVESQWGAIRDDPGRPLLDRAIQGLYPPGSTMKIVTASLGLARYPGLGAESYNCTGQIAVQGRVLKCPQAHGTVDLNSALAVSCNCYFATLGLRLGAGDFSRGLAGFGWGENLAFDLPLSQIPFDPKSFRDPNGLADASIGQGKILVSPLYMAMIAGAIGNGGAMMQPYLVQEIRSPGGAVLWEARPQLLRRVVSPQVASQVQEAMVGVVDSGTGTAAYIPGVEVAGKTGSAEVPDGPPHAWFVAFAPARNPTVAVCVVVEHGGEGGRTAAPIARELIRLALTQ